MVGFDVLLRSFQLAVEGSRTNYFGLGCPVYCFQPSFATYLLTLFLGFALGLSSAVLGLWLCWKHFGTILLPVPSPPSSSDHSRTPDRYSKLAGYVNEHKQSRRRGVGT